jgi:hypothetical protein
MLVDELIFPMDEAECINPIVIRSKKGNDDIRVYVDYRSLNLACVHNPFPTSFSDLVLDQVAGNEAYYFTDGFSCYHQVKIVEEDKIKTTFTT